VSTEESPSQLPERETKYGVHVKIDSAVLRESELGSFDGSDFQGRLSRTTVREQIYGTDTPGIEAVGYGFESSRSGMFSPPALWSLLSIFSSAFLFGLFGYRILYPDLDLGLPVWVYYAILITIFFFAKTMETRRVKRFVALSLAAKTLTDLEGLYGRNPIIDLPIGRAAEVRSAVEEALKPFPKLPALPERSRPKGSSSSGVTEQRGELHGNLS